MRIGHLDAGIVITRANVHLCTLWAHPHFPKEPERQHGGYLCIAKKEDPTLILIARIGECDFEQGQRYLGFAREKAMRLHNMAKKEGHVSSWQSRDEEKNRYGGAIAAGDYIFSFSGLPEKADEALVMQLAYDCSTSSDEERRQIAMHSQNEFFLE